MSNRILFTDMDGTLLDRNKQVSPALRKRLQRLTESGVHLVFSTGRALDSVLKVTGGCGLLAPDTLIIAANGNEIYDCASQRFLSRKTVPLSIVSGCIELAKKHGIHIQSYTTTHVVCERDCPELAHYKKFTGMDAILTDDVVQTIETPPFKLLAIDLSGRRRLEALQKDVLERYGDTVTAMFSCDEYLEIFDKTAGKGNAVRFVCEHLNIPLSESVAVGDAENDISMLQAAGTGAAMTNADEKVKAAADFITERDNDHDGLADVIEKFFEPAHI